MSLPSLSVVILFYSTKQELLFNNTKKPVVFIHSCRVCSKERQSFWVWLPPRKESHVKEMPLIWHDHVWTLESRSRNWRFCNLALSYLDYCVNLPGESWQLKIGTLYLIIKSKTMRLSNEDDWYDIWTPIYKKYPSQEAFSNDTSHAASGSKKETLSIFCKVLCINSSSNSCSNLIWVA